MVLLNAIKGQKNAVKYLSNSLSLNRIANSYLFSGPEGTGRVPTAKAFIMALICKDGGAPEGACGVCASCRRIDTLEHPDIVWIKPEKNKTIKIEEIRKVKDRLNLKPYESDRNVCVVEDAHAMTVEASNALLKILEEPPGNSVLILATNKKELLLETVISRCSEVRFHSLSMEDTKNIVMEDSDIAEDKAYFLAYFSQGSPGRALEMIEEDVLHRKDTLLGLVDNIVEEENAGCLNWDEASKDQLIEDIEMLIMFFRDITIGREGLEDKVFDRTIMKTGMYDFFKKYPTAKIYDTIDRLIRLKRGLMGNVNPKLVTQVLPGQLIK